MQLSLGNTLPEALRQRINDLAEAARLAKAASPDPGHEKDLVQRVKTELTRQGAVLIAHYYVDESLQELAEQTGGFVGDSLEMARFGQKHPAHTVVVAGVRFMGETAKILCPQKRVLVLDQQAECSLDLSCPAESFSASCDQHPDRTVVVYANTSAAVKARADWTVTSAIGLDIVAHLASKGEKVLWAPDRYLGGYIQRVTGADMLLWPGSCIVHEEFRAETVQAYQKAYPDAAVLVHPESPPEVIALADAVGSTTQMIKAAQQSSHHVFIVATEQGILHKMKQAAPDKVFLPLPTGGPHDMGMRRAICPWMKLNDLTKLERVLKTGENEIFVEESISRRAVVSIQRMLDFAELKARQSA
ncbi:MAG TPA: quinolinate synthase NadA [Desulfonatronum sp.]|nr:quinolinate synthase NadA [Desulfonatronum sp.]